MHIVDGALVLSATDLTSFLACEHLTELERAAAENGLKRPERDDPELTMLRKRGAEHETAHLAQLRSAGKSVAEIEREGHGLEGLHDLEARTLAGMRQGFDVIYQGGFFDGRWYGRADFLLRVEKPSGLGAWSYEVADAKLARTLKVDALIQMADYSRHVARLQGVAPEHVHVIPGRGATESRPLSDVAAYYEAARRRFENAISQVGRSTYPEVVDHCKVCRWAEVCDAKRRGDDHLSVVAGAHRPQITKLRAVGVNTVIGLADRIDPVAGLTDAALTKLREQARLQVSARGSGVMEYRLIEADSAHRGLGLLPEPSDGDLFFDMEGDVFAGDDGLEYLFGVLERVDGVDRYTSFWGHDAAQERRAFEAFMDFVMQKLECNPRLHIYHYAAYEVAALKRLAGRYATREDDVDRLLRGKSMVDLYTVVRQSVRASTESYSLKALEPFFMAERTDRIRDAGSSLVAYERWLDDGAASRLRDIEDYNKTDCRSAMLLRAWLESLRGEYALRFGDEPPRPETRAREPTEDNARITAETAALFTRLTAGVPDAAELRSDEQRARTLLAGMLDWHRREARPQWWEYFARLEMDGEQLRDDAYALAGLEPLAARRLDDKSLLQSYAFDPAQETRIDAGENWYDPASEKPAGEVMSIDRVAGRIELRRTAKAQERGQPGALVPPPPVRDTVQREALGRVGEWVAANGVDTPGPYGAVRELLLGRLPRVGGHSEGEHLRQQGEAAVDAACRIALALNQACLPIQGPPGSGKTYAASHIALRLVAARPRRRVGITALSHRAISHLLDETCKEARRRGVAPGAVQAAKAHQRCSTEWVRCVNENSAVAPLLDDGVDIVAGTSWLFSRPDMQGTLDTLIIDEASQMSLANVVAMSGAARNIVLCGDPQQLSQPTRGTHPAGADRSALQHVLGNAHTIPPEKGLFLDVTRRMHPELCAVVSDVFYDGFLTSEASCAKQAIHGTVPELSGAGLRFLPVVHRGNRVRSSEEADAVSELVRRLLEGTWTDADGVTRPLTVADCIVLAPYNAQVAVLATGAPRGTQVGTVDKFQGQQAPVAIYSMATSSPEDQRRGMGFLYSLNRLDVALSRARAIAVLVCSPELTRVHCRTVDQLVLANALCRLMERAVPIRLPTAQHRLDFPGDLEVLAGVNAEDRG